MKTYNLASFSGYPMYQTLKKTNKGIDTGSNELFGDSLITIVVKDNISVGDTLTMYNEKHTVKQVTEEREARGNHKDGATFQRLECSYVEALPQEA